MIHSAEALHSLFGQEPFPPSTEGGAEAYAAAAGLSALRPSATALELAEAFSDFVSTSARLEHSYRELQSEVYGLRMELAERNAALRASLSENERVRLALHEIVDSMPCGVLVATRSGQLTTINAEAARLLELSRLPATIRELEAEHGLNFCFAKLASDGADVEQEFCWSGAASERWLNITVRQLHGHSPDGLSRLTIFIVRDVTSQKRAEKHREEARNAMVLAQITSMLAHEIRNPLGSMELFAELLETDPAGRAGWIANLRAGIRSLSGTVNNVLTLHDPGSLKLTALNLFEVVSGLVRFSLPLADQASVSLLWEAPPYPVRVMGNEGALRQVLLNLIRNAIRHTPAGGAITLSVEQTGPTEVALLCTDTGCGLDSGQMVKIFQPGFSGTGDSPGLGLAVCERILSQHGGSISAENAVGAGARFILTLPQLTEESLAA